MQSFSSPTAGGITAIRAAIRALVDASAPVPVDEDQPRPSDDFATLKREVSERGLLRREPSRYAWIIARTFALTALAWTALVLARGSALVWFVAPLLAFASGQLVLLAHDACHHAIFRDDARNDALGLVAINLLNGGSFTWWTASHNAHHARSNFRQIDPDIDYPMFAFDRAQADEKHRFFEPILARQHWLAWLMLAGVALNLRVYGLVHLLRGRARRAEIAAFALHWTLYPLAMVSLLGGWRALAMIALQQALFGTYVGSITVANHWAMPMPEPGTLGFVAHQVSTSRNISGESLADLWFGGLNLQVEHHLFPSMPRANLRSARASVQAFCEARGIAYVERSITEAYREIYRAMREVARYVRERREGAR
ncbi:MAG: acyl-CoA desaturase [Polyangiales bacterium]